MVAMLKSFLVLSLLGFAKLFGGILGQTLEPTLLLPSLAGGIALLKGDAANVPTDPWLLESAEGIQQIMVDAGLEDPNGIGVAWLVKLHERVVAVQAKVTAAAATP